MKRKLAGSLSWYELKTKQQKPISPYTEHYKHSPVMTPHESGAAELQADEERGVVRIDDKTDISEHHEVVKGDASAVDGDLSQAEQKKLM